MDEGCRSSREQYIQWARPNPGGGWEGATNWSLPKPGGSNILCSMATSHIRVTFTKVGTNTTNQESLAKPAEKPTQSHQLAMLSVHVGSFSLCHGPNTSRNFKRGGRQRHSSSVLCSSCIATHTTFTCSSTESRVQRLKGLTTFGPSNSYVQPRPVQDWVYEYWEHNLLGRTHLWHLVFLDLQY